jgi:RHS repeat-associated protein
MIKKSMKLILSVILGAILSVAPFNIFIFASDETQTVQTSSATTSTSSTEVEPCWDGDGLKGFTDYINNGEEHVNIYRQSLSILAPVYSLKSRGMDINLTRAYEFGHSRIGDPFFISFGWYWALPYVLNGRLCLPNGTTHKMFYNPDWKTSSSLLYDCGDVVFREDLAYSDSDQSLTTTVYLNDGTKIELNNKKDYEMVYDTKGNWIRYYFGEIIYQDAYHQYTYKRISSLSDSSGHTFSFRYNQANDFSQPYPVLESVDQILNSGSPKRILTHGYGDGWESFTDAAGRTTTYWNKYQPDPNTTTRNITKIQYPNGLTSAYNYDEVRRIASQSYNKPGSFSKNITYNRGYTNISDSQTILSTITVDDGICKKIYHYTGLNPGEPFGFTFQEETFSPSGKLLKQINYTYQYIKNFLGRIEFARQLSVTNVAVKVDGSIGSSATYRYIYDNWVNRTSITDPYGTITRMAYANTDSNSNLGSLTPGMQNYCFTTHASYDKIGFNKPLTVAVLVKDPVHNTTQLKQTHYLYDAAGNLLTERAVYGSSYLDTTYTYDAYGNIKTKTDANGNKLLFDYDSTQTYPSRTYMSDGANIATYQYDKNLGLPITVTDPNGNTFNYQYDAIGRLTRETLANGDPEVGVTRKITYNDAASLVSLDFGNEPTGLWQHGRIYYDPAFGKPLQIQRQLNSGSWVTIKQFTYDSNGRLTTEKDNRGHTIAHGYDALDREITTTFPDGTTMANSWDGRQLTVTDANNNRKVQNYDLLDRLVSAVEYSNSTTSYTTSYTYDTDSRLIRAINPLMADTTNTYDNLGQLIKTDYPQDGENPLASEAFSYDGVGNLKSKTNSNGTKNIEYEFFAGCRPRSVTEPDGRVITYTYDNNDNLLTQTCPGASYTYSNYDARNRAHNFMAQLDGTPFSFAYDYDVFGRMTSITYPNRTNPVSYNYDELDRLQSIPGFVTSCGYDGDNKLTDMLFGNGINNHYDYRANDDKLAGIKIGPSGSLLTLNYSYDNVGNIKQINNDYYGYDGLNRLTWEGNLPQNQLSSATGTSWLYDGAGNMSGKTTYQSGQTQGNIPYHCDKANRLYSMGAVNLSYNSRGACTRKVSNNITWDYNYDGENRLTGVSKNGTQVETNSYDGSGMRVKRVNGGVTAYYIYNGANPLVEYTPADSACKYYIYANNSAVAEEKNGQVRFNHRDHLGSLRLITDANGNVVDYMHYSAYGEAKPPITDNFVGSGFVGWTINTSGAQFLLNNGVLQITHTINDYCGDYIVKRFDKLQNVIIQFDATISSINNDCCSLGIELDGLRLVFYGSQLYYYNNGWQLVGTVAFDQANHYQLVITQEQVEIWINNELKYTINGSFGTKSYLAFRDYGLCFGPVTNSIDNVSIAPLNTENGEFTGKKFDPDTGLVYFGGRFYDPEIGRFITQDPGKQGLNWYVYCFNNPLKMIDPNGENAIIVNDRSPVGGLGHAFVIAIDPSSGIGYTYSFEPKSPDKFLNAPGNIHFGEIPSDVMRDKDKTLDWLVKNQFLDSANGVKTVGIETDTYETKDMLSFLNGAKNNVPTYDLFNNNCMSFVTDTLSAGGENMIGKATIDIPNFITDIYSIFYHYDPWSNDNN